MVAHTLIPALRGQRQKDYCKFGASLEDPISIRRDYINGWMDGWMAK